MIKKQLNGFFIILLDYILRPAFITPASGVWTEEERCLPRLERLDRGAMRECRLCLFIQVMSVE